MIKNHLALLLMIITPYFLHAQPGDLLRNTIQVTAEGKYEAEPDTALLEFSISMQQKTYKEANEAAVNATKKIAALLKKYKLDPKQAEFSLFQTQPVYDYENPKRPIIGYRVNSQVSIKFNDFSKLSYILPDLMKTNITDNQSVNYILENTEQAKRKAIQNAYQRARSMAESLAQADNKTVDEMIYASIDTFENKPLFRTMMAKGTSSAQESSHELFGAQKIAITAQIKAIFDVHSLK